MRFTAIILALAAAAVAVPTTANTFAAQAAKAFEEAPECHLPDPGTNCAGAANMDVVVSYGKDMTQAEKDLYLNAAKGAGANIIGTTGEHGFYGFIPESFVSLMNVTGQSCGLKVFGNGCMGIPWCGEAPC